MAKMNYVPGSSELHDALRAMGIEPNVTRRVVIVIESGNIPVIHIERFADRQVVDVMAILARNPRGVRVEHGSAETERHLADDDWSIVVRPQDPGIVHVWCGNAQLHDAAPLSAHAARRMAQDLLDAARLSERPR